jgi:hypothetical protein
MDQPISQFNPIVSGATINLATLPTRNLTIRANTSPATVGSVQFDLVESAFLNTVNTSPYDLCGDGTSTPVACSNLGVGLHSLTTTPYMGSKASGAKGTSMSISFSVIDPTPTPTPTPTRTPTSTPTPGNVVGPAGYPLTAPVGYGNPITFGATGNGTTDDTAAFQSAVNAGNVYVSQTGTYLIVGQVLMPSNRILQCASGVILKTNKHDSNDSGLLRLNSTNNVAILGCTLIGTNTTVPPILDGNQGNSLISLFGATNTLIAANTCKWSWSNSCIHLTDSTDSNTGTPSSNNTIRNNELDATGYYGVAIIDGIYNTVNWNNAVDAAIGSEANSGETPTGNSHNTYSNNVVTKVHTNGYNNVILTGGAAISNFDYSTNMVSNNHVTGSGSAILVDDGGGEIQAHYTNNLCDGGCITK